MRGYERNRRKKGRIILVLVLIASMAIAAVYMFFPELIPQFLRFSRPYRAVASGTVIPLSSDVHALLKAPNPVTVSDIEAAIENNHNDNFQHSFQTEAAYVVDESGEVLYAKNEHTRLYPASTTKMLTAYLALTHTEELDTLITVDELSGCYEWGSLLLGLEQGDQISMRDLLHALLMCSYNDSATAIAMEVGGSLEGFASMMNTQLQTIGARETHFVTPHGLHNDEHYTTAYDLNLILQMAYELESLREIMMTEKATIKIIRDGKPVIYDLQNSNFFIRGAYEVPTMEYLGGKTGYTEKAGSCLASVFDHDGTKYFSIIMKAEDASYMTAILFDYYFAPEALSSFSSTIPLMRD